MGAEHANVHNLRQCLTAQRPRSVVVVVDDDQCSMSVVSVAGGMLVVLMMMIVLMYVPGDEEVALVEGGAGDEVDGVLGHELLAQVQLSDDREGVQTATQRSHR
jgi:hypothetical protein